MGGKQIIIVADFLQLPPIQNLFDPGTFAFNSPVFVKSILHRVELKTLWRQDSFETKFLECLKELRIGSCSEESSNFIQNLSRELPYSISKHAVHIFFRRLPMQVHNANMLLSLPEKELFKFDAIDTALVHNIQQIRLFCSNLDVESCCCRTCRIHYAMRQWVFSLGLKKNILSLSSTMLEGLL